MATTVTTAGAETDRCQIYERKTHWHAFGPLFGPTAWILFGCCDLTRLWWLWSGKARTAATTVPQWKQSNRIPLSGWGFGINTLLILDLYLFVVDQSGLPVMATTSPSLWDPTGLLDLLMLNVAIPRGCCDCMAYDKSWRVWNFV